MMLLAQHMALMDRWTPAQVAVPPQIYLDHRSSVTDASGAASQWDDRSGNGYNFIQAAPLARPTIVENELNGQRVLRFNGVNNNLAGSGGAVNLFSSVASAWLFVAIKKSTNDGSPTSRHVLVATAGNGNARVSMYSDDATSGSANRLTMGGRRLDAGTYQSIRSSASIYDRWVMALGMHDYTARTISLYVDGALDASASGAFDASGSTSASAGTRFGLGGGASGAFWAGDFAAALAGVSLPSAADIDRIFGYYAWEFGLQANLPSGHPYKSFAP